MTTNLWTTLRGEIQTVDMWILEYGDPPIRSGGAAQDAFFLIPNSVYASVPSAVTQSRIKPMV